jgi:hypothetical protein
MIYACPMLEYVLEAQLLKLQRLWNTLHHTTGNTDRCTPVHKLNVAFKIPYVYDYIIKLSRIHAEVIVIRVIPNVRGIGQGEARHGKYKRLNLGSGQAYVCSAD